MFPIKIAFVFSGIEEQELFTIYQSAEDLKICVNICLIGKETIPFVLKMRLSIAIKCAVPFIERLKGISSRWDSQISLGRLYFHFQFLCVCKFVVKSLKQTLYVLFIENHTLLLLKHRTTVSLYFRCFFKYLCW